MLNERMKLLTRLLRKHSPHGWSLLLPLIAGCSGCGSFVGDGVGCAMIKTAAVPAAGWESASRSFDRVAFGLGDQKAKVSSEELAEQKDFYRRILAGDPDAVAACAMRCELAAVLGARDHWGWTLEIASAKRVIDWWGSQPEPDQLPVLMVAYNKIGREYMASDTARAENYLQRAAALSVDPRIVAAMTSPRYGANRYRYYDEGAQDIQSRLIRLRFSGIPGRAADPSMPPGHCQAAAAWPPAWMRADRAMDVLNAACLEADRMEHVQLSLHS